MFIIWRFASTYIWVLLSFHTQDWANLEEIYKQHCFKATTYNVLQEKRNSSHQS